MPYELTKQGCPKGKPFGVRNKVTGEIKGCSETEEQAKAHMRALYANEPRNKSKVKAAIKRENGIDYPARDFAYVPDPASPSTWKLRLTETPGKISEAQLRRAAMALSPAGFRGNRVELPPNAVSSVKRRIRAEFRRLGVDENDIPQAVKSVKLEEEEPLYFFKDAKTDQTRWFAIYSNNFRDDDQPAEIISEQSHLNFVDLVDQGIVDYPELWLWHIKGTAWGKADWVAYAHGFAMASGLVYPGYEFIANKLKQKKDTRVSHGMPEPLVLYDPQDDSTIRFHVTAEISPLPGFAAANKLTGFTLLQGETQMANKDVSLPLEKRKFLKELAFSDEDIAALEAKLRDTAEAASKSGLQSKASNVVLDEDEIEEFDTGDLALGSEDGDGEQDDAVDEAVDEVETEPVATKARAVAPAADDEMSSAAKKRKKKAAVMAQKEIDAPLTRDEVAGAMGEVLSPLVKEIEALRGQVNTLTKEYKRLATSDAEKIAHTKETTPTLSLADLISRNIVGKEKARIDEGSSLEKAGPVETDDTAAPVRTPIPFVNQMIAANGKASAH